GRTTSSRVTDCAWEVLSDLVAKVSGKSYEDFVKDQLGALGSPTRGSRKKHPLPAVPTRQQIGHQVEDLVLFEGVEQTFRHHRDLRSLDGFHVAGAHFHNAARVEQVGHHRDGVALVVDDVAVHQHSVGRGDDHGPVLVSNGLARIEHLLEQV